MLIMCMNVILILSSIICDGQSLDGFSVYIQTQTYMIAADGKAVSPVSPISTAVKGGTILMILIF